MDDSARYCASSCEAGLSSAPHASQKPPYSPWHNAYNLYGSQCAVYDSDDHDMDGETGAGAGAGSVVDATGSQPSATTAPASGNPSGKKAIKGIIRRASVSLHVSLHGLMQRRASFAAGGSSSSKPGDDVSSAAAATATPAWTPAAASTTNAAAIPTSASTPSHFLPNRLLRSSHTHSHSHSHAHLHGQWKQAARMSQPPPAPSGTDRRPTTSHAFPGWRRVRQAASFRHSRVFDSDVSIAGASDPHAYDGQHTDDDRAGASAQRPRSSMVLSTSAPLPSSGGLSSMQKPPSFSAGPPVIPPNTGSAARAAAAAAFHSDVAQVQQQMQQLEWRPPGIAASGSSAAASPPTAVTSADDFLYGNDHESGIGIAVTPAGSDSANEEGIGSSSSVDAAWALGSGLPSSPTTAAPGISKVDFVEKLPTELAIGILSKLDCTSLASAARVSRTWYHVTRNQHIWRESFFREKTTTYATGGPVAPGRGLGVPTVHPARDWQQIYRAKQELDRCWREGKTRPVYLSGHTDSIYCLQFDEHKIITGSRDKTIRIWDAKTFACRMVIGPTSVTSSPTLLYDEDGRPTHFVTDAWHTRGSYSVPERVTFPMYHSASILCLQYDDEMLVTGSSDETCIVYDLRDGIRPVRRLVHHEAAILDLCFDAKHIVTCSKDTTICVWDRATGTMLKQLRGHSGPVNAVQMRGNTIVSCSGDFRVMLWNIETGRPIREFTGHTKGLACSQFSEDGRFVASAGSDRIIRIWNAHTGECLREMEAHENLVRSLHIDSITGRLVSASYDRDIKVFDMATGLQLLDFPQWHQSWVLSAKSDYRRIISTGQDPKILVMDFGASIDGIELLASGSGGGGHIYLPKDEAQTV